MDEPIQRRCLLAGLACLLGVSATTVAGYAQGTDEAARPPPLACDLDCVVADIVATAGRVDGGDVYDPMGVAASMLVDIATVLARSGRLHRAAALLARLPELPLAEWATRRQRVRANLALAEAHAAAGRVAEADRLFEQASALTDALGSSPVWLRSELARALLRTGRTTAARHALALIDDARYRARVLADMAVALAQSGDAQAARTMLGDAFRAVAKQTRGGIHGRISAFGVIAGGLVTLGEANEALALAATVDSSFERVGTMAAIAVAQHEAGTPAAAQETLFGALAIADTIVDGHIRAWALQAIVEGGELYNHSLPGDPPPGSRSVASPAVAHQLNALAAAIDPPSRNHALSVAVRALARAGETAAALATAAEISGECSPAQALATAAAAQAAAGRIDEAIATAHRVGANVRDCGYKDNALAAVATAQAESGQLDAALATLADIERDAPRLGTLATIGKALANATAKRQPDAQGL